MSYQVLARKWRPRSFSEMVGQEHVLRALINALDAGRLHHAFLFTGTRGVGKTTIARILAKSLNCERGVGSRPCGECAACREIDGGRFVDLIEVDAASRTRVEDTRELLENVPYAPTRGRYKVYLIDEVHMLSGHSFNALLKTLEEPPPHVKFLLATTDPQRLPITILSRCLQFNLKRLPPELIRGHLARITAAEGIEAEPAALAEVARAADGSMRDALSLLDQAIAYGGGRLPLAEVREMLGTIDRDRVLALIEALAAGDGEGLIGEANVLAEQAPDYAGVLAELAATLQRLALAQVVPQALDAELPEHGRVMELARQVAPEDVQLYYQIAVTGRRDLPLAPDPRSGFEMVLLRMLAFRPAGGPEGGEVRRERPAEPAPRPVVVAAAEAVVPPRPSAPEPPPVASPPEPVAPAPAAESPPVASEGGRVQEWARLVAQLPISGLIQQLAVHSTLVSRDADRIELVLDSGAQHLHNKKREEGLREALERHFGHPLALSLRIGQADVTPDRLRRQEAAERQQGAELALAEDPTLHDLLGQFDGRVVPGSIRAEGG